ncbi:hypothetical protein G9463_13645 [Haloarcula sp. JP-Z28]|uniref:hypothetical protein n=1 Tax=Haloarcula sp. JP-Z28 TaxID=2716715 RepID=UPI00140507DE|nr:hypothetical protein [Haloarcula sp. JP-Z28]NHN64333.1 hypothetical protein [Haloarcula sp. JP-Z28]
MFNFDPGSDIYVDTTNDNVTIRFDGDTFGINPTTNGFSATNDWNSRHFTLAFDENSILYHVTRENDNDKTSGKKAVPPEEFVAEIYGYIRSIATPVPEDRLNLSIVGQADIDEMESYLKDKGVARSTGAGLQVDNNEREKLVNELNEKPAALGSLYRRVLDPVSFDEATDPESGENIFFYPTADAIIMLFMFPDKYVGITTANEVLRFVDYAGGSQIIDHVLRSMSGR